MIASSYQDFMNCLHPIVRLTHTMICGLVLWEHIQACNAAGKPSSEIDFDAVAQEVNQRFSQGYHHLYAAALAQWLTPIVPQTMEETDAAADMGGCNSIQPNNST